MLGPRISADVRTEEAGRRTDGCLEEYKAAGAIVAEELVLVGGLHAGVEIAFATPNPRGWS